MKPNQPAVGTLGTGKVYTEFIMRGGSYVCESHVSSLLGKCHITLEEDRCE